MVRMTKEALVAELTARNIQFDEQAGYHDLYRLLNGQSAEEPVDDSVDLEKLALHQQLEETQARLDAATAIKGIPTASRDKVQGELVRPEEVMRRNLPFAVTKKKEDMSEPDKVAIEREIRRYVKKGGLRKNHKEDLYNVPGGYRKGITAERKEYVDVLLKRIGRVDKDGKPIPAWDDSILVPGMSEALRNQSKNG